MTAHSELVARLEGASEGSSELSAHVIKAALAPEHTWVEQSKFNGVWCIYERPEKPRIWEVSGSLRGASVTESIDAALALAERVLPGRAAGVSQQIHHGHWYAWLTLVGADGDPWTEAGANAPTPALALCAAILRAQPQPDGEKT